MSKKNPIQLSDHFTYARLFRFILPSIVMMVFTSIYGVVDGLFVSNFAGKTAFASINLIMPFLIILGAMGFMLGTGGTALVSRVLGEGDKACANKYFSMITLFGILLGVILTVVGVLAMRPMAILLGATEAMVDDCVLYGRIVVCFLTSFMLQNMFQSFLIAAERPKFGLLITLAAGVTNMVLDALFVGVFRWGIAGAAIATGISQTVGGRCAADVLPVQQKQPPASALDEVRSAAAAAIVRQRLIRADEQHFRLADWDAVQRTADALPGRGRRGDVWRTDVCAVHFCRD